MRTINEQIGEALAKEDGGGYGFVCIWRKKEDDPNKEHDRAFKGTVGEFLMKPENQKGTWLIDGGWGGPPGAIHVRWNDRKKEWENGGYCGRGFKT